MNITHGAHILAEAATERKDMFYLTMHSTHFIYEYHTRGTHLSRGCNGKEGYVLFNDALNTFYL